MTLHFQDKRTREVKEARKRTRHVPQTGDWSFSFPMPSSITATTKVRAVLKYRKLVDGIAAEIVSKQAVMCAACDGTGVIIAD